MLRFTIRDLLWLMMVVAVSLGWWAERAYDKRQSAIERKKLADDLDALYRDRIERLEESRRVLLGAWPRGR